MSSVIWEIIFPAIQADLRSKADGMNEKAVDYMDMAYRFDAEERASRGERVALPEPAGEPVVDYLAVSKAWKEECGWMDNQQNEMRG